MEKRVFIVHGWDGYPEEGWFHWLKKELEVRGFKVFATQLPDAGNPRISKWIPALAKAVGMADKNTYFVGHSLGCQAIVRFLELLPGSVKIGGAIFVAGFLKRLTNLENDEEVRDVAREWLTTPINLEKVKLHLNKSIAVFSDNDPYVPLDNQDDFRNKLGFDIIIEHQKGHFSGPRDGITKLPIVLRSVLKISGYGKEFDKWNIKKKDLHSKQFNIFYHEREIWWCSLGINIGFEQDGTGNNFDRPIVIVRGFNKNTFFVVGLTGRKKIGKYYFYLGKIDGKEATAVLSQVRLLDSRRLVRKIGTLDEAAFEKLKLALIKALFDK